MSVDPPSSQSREGQPPRADGPPSAQPTTESGPGGAGNNTEAGASWWRQFRESLPEPVGAGVGALSWLLQKRVSFGVAFFPLLLLCFFVFSRSPWTNYIFDEQEALLANPYVNGQEVGFFDVLKRDFWGLPPTRTIGSYRPLPNVVWRLLWMLSERPWWPHLFNIVIHACNAALLATLAQRWLNSRLAAWLCGLTFALSAVLTEAVCGVVGIADVLSGLFTLLVLWALRLSWWWQLPCAFGFLFLGLMSKESTLTVTPLVVWVALVVAPLDHPSKPWRWLRPALVAIGALAALIAYTELRKRFFPVAMPPEFQAPLPETEPLLKRGFHEFLRWFQQPRLPADPINNPLVEGNTAERISGALRVYFRGLVQVVFPWQLSGDYSYPQEPVPKQLFSLESVLGGAAMILPPFIGLGAWLRSIWLERSDDVHAPGKRRLLCVLALTLVWVPLTYFPHSNIPIVLPTVRAERFWYLPVVLSSLLWGYLLWRAYEFCLRHWSRRVAVGVVLVFLGFQGIRARMHALDYRSDLAFWAATASAVPNSAKAHLNYGVMLGARGKLDERLVENGRARELAPEWPMANVYYGDTLCRLKRLDEAWPHYKRGFELGPNEQSLIALALQCMWDAGAIEAHAAELKELAKQHKGSWLAYLANDVVNNGKKHGGVDPRYRPRGYNQKARDKKKQEQSSSATASAQQQTAQTATASEVDD